MKPSFLLLVGLPLISMSCAPYDIVQSGHCVPLDRDEVRRMDEPSQVTTDPGAALDEVTTHRQHMDASVVGI